MDPRTKDAAALLVANARELLNGGLAMLLEPSAIERDARVALLSIQAAVELFAKSRIVRDLGLEAILTKALPSGDLLALARSGALKTVSYDRCLDTIDQLEGFDEWQVGLLRDLQGLRNTVAHFAGQIDVEDMRSTVCALMVPVLAIFALAEGRDEGEMRTHRQFLEDAVFEALLRDPSYRDEAFDSATAVSGRQPVYPCWSCEQETMTIRNEADHYFCFTCGLSAYLDAASFTACYSCRKERHVCYDALNTTRGLHYGRCLSCQRIAWVARCELCGTTRSFAAMDQSGPCGCAASS